MKIAVAKEIDPSEPRVAASPGTAKKFKALGAEVAVEPGAGIKSGLPDSEFTAAGATVSADAVRDADIVIKVKRPEPSELRPRGSPGACNDEARGRGRDRSQAADASARRDRHQ
jgi:NAD(P) transhydrogenase subunit alpha